MGKLLGLMIGLGIGLASGGWLAAVLCALVGAFAGHKYDELHALPDEGATLAFDTAAAAEPLPRPSTAEEVETESRVHFARHVCALFAEVARADGEVVRDEVRIVRTFFEEQLQFRKTELDLVRRALKEALANPPDLAEAIAACRQELRGSERLLVLDALYELALADGSLRRSEQDALRRVATGLQISDEDRRAIAALHLGDGQDAYEVLGLTADATDDQLRRAYRKLAATHHPDRVAHLGPGPMEVAARRFRELNEAWETLRKLRAL